MYALKRCTKPHHSVASDDPIGSSNTNMLTKMISHAEENWSIFLPRVHNGVEYVLLFLPQM